jgi:hypothetical protein
MTFCLVLLLVRDAGALDACGEATEEMADAMSSKINWNCWKDV